MKLSEYKKDYYEFSSLASSTARQLAFAGIAIIWIFKSQVATGYQLPNELLLPSIFLIISLGSDLLQYVSGTVIWGMFHRYNEKSRTSDEDPNIDAPFYYTWPINFFFYAKIFSVLVSYGFLANYAISSVTFK